jgi:anion-transporting  ArsA/GET3 family ATPase
LKNTRVIVSIGTGGVGKTTVSAGLGLYLASLGNKVLVLTIDPSKRLATTLGIGEEKGIVKVKLGRFADSFKGELYASIVDHQSVFNDFILRSSRKGGHIEKILNNKLYQQLSTSLSGSQEFTALEKLYSCFISKEFDYIVLDTPPAKHAIDFLSAPEKLASLFSENITKWFKDTQHGGNWLAAMISSGTRQVLKILEVLTGSEFVKELSLFFYYINDWQDQLHDRTLKAHELLVNPLTEFYLVTSIDPSKLKEATLLLKEIRKQGYSLTKVIMNRSIPSWDITKEFVSLPDLSVEKNQELVRLFNLLKSVFHHKSMTHQKFLEELQKTVQVLSLTEYNKSISDIESLDEVSREIGLKIQFGEKI